MSPKDVDGVERYIDELTVEIEYDDEGVQHMIMNGMDVSGDIRTQDISQKVKLFPELTKLKLIPCLLHISRISSKHSEFIEFFPIITCLTFKLSIIV